MKQKFFLPFLFLFIFCYTTAQPEYNSLQNQSNAPRFNVLFDFDWRFHRGDITNGEKEQMNDASWRKADLPHDWSIEDLQGKNTPFDPDALNDVDVGFTTGGTGWYRKTFDAPATLQNKKLYLQFDGVYMNADVWLNGKFLGNHVYGYTSFGFDITDQLRFGQQNILRVKAKNEGENSRWYSGSGIYRHVWLKIMEPVHVAQWGTYIATTNVNATSAKVNAKTKVNNDTKNAQDFTVISHIVNDKDLDVAKTESKQMVAANSSLEYIHQLTVTSPELWSPETPALYTLITEVFGTNNSIKQQLLDRIETKFGIRSISFNAQTGFLLNGRQILLKGGCMHHDNGPLGSAAFDRAEERRIELMKANGFNAIRCAHNPPSPAFLEACDRIGMLVIDEAFDMWREANNPQDYHLYFDSLWQSDIESMVYRDRNHPSVIMWSIGNEIKNSDNPEVAQLAKTLAGYVRSIDNTRPITSAVNSVTEKKDPYFAALDICGYNYAEANYGSDHQRKPKRVMFGSESYPLTAFENWMAVLDHQPWVIGDFVWTGFDYLGEGSIGWLGYPQSKDFYPWSHAYCGDIDICGWKRPQSYFRDALWKNGNNISIFVKLPQPSFKENPKKESWSIWNWHDVFPDWNWKGYENKPFEVEVYSSCEEAELFLNGKSLGKKETIRSTKFTAMWQVPYEAGVLKAVGYNGSQQVVISELKTANDATQIKLSADKTGIKSNGQDLSYITVELVDANNILNPKANNLVHFKIEGAGTIVAVGSSNPMSTESFRQPQRKAWHGKCLVVVKSIQKEGKIVLKASAEGLESAIVIINTRL
jgi:beta-galactosidase